MIDRRFVDVDLSDVPEDQSSGWLEQTDEEMLAATKHIKLFSEEFPDKMIPRSQWREMALANVDKLRKTTKQIYSQSRTSACVGFGIGQAAETRSNRLLGVDRWTPLSGMSLYKRIGRTLMSGAYIPDGINHAVEEGILPLECPQNEGRYEHTWPLLEYYKDFPDNWLRTAKGFRITKWARCQGAEEVMSALLTGFTGVVGRNRHCVPYVYPDFDGNTPYACYANSWSPNWGDEGFGYDSIRVFDSLQFYVILEMSVFRVPIPQIQ